MPEQLLAEVVMDGINWQDEHLIRVYLPETVSLSFREKLIDSVHYPVARPGVRVSVGFAINTIDVEFHPLIVWEAAAMDIICEVLGEVYSNSEIYNRHLIDHKDKFGRIYKIGSVIKIKE